MNIRACLKIHCINLHAPLCSLLHPDLVSAAPLRLSNQGLHPTNWNAQLGTGNFKHALGN